MSDRKVHLVMLVGLALASTAGAVPLVESPYGGQNAFLLPEINAMGGTGVALYRGGMSGLLNPAMLTAEQGVRFDFGAALDHADEDRYQPLYDTFSSYETDMVIASNRHDNYGAGLALAGRLLDGPNPLVASLSLADRYAFSYAFAEEIRDPDSGTTPRDQILENRLYEVKGALRDLTLGLATDILPGYSLGAAVNYAFGSRDEVWNRRYFDTPDSSYRLAAQWNPTGVNATVGLRMRLGQRVVLGAAYESPLTASGDLDRSYADATDSSSTASAGVDVRYPGEVRVGVTMLPRNNPRTVFSAELAYRQWGKLEDDRVTATHLQDVVDVRLGVQHSFAGAKRMLFGFRHYDSYLDRDAGTSVFSAGLGTPVGGGELVASLELSKVSSYQRHLFPYPDGVTGYGDPITADPISRVEDTRVRAAVGFTRNF